MSEDLATVSPEALSERLRAYARLVGLIADQLDAARNDDSELIHRLQEEQVVLERDLTSLLVVELDGEPSEPAPPLACALAKDVGVAIETLGEYLGSEQRARANWLWLNDGVIRTAREIPVPQPAGRRYPEYDAGESRVDLRF